MPKFETFADARLKLVNRLLAGTALGLVLTLPAYAGQAPAQAPTERVVITGERPEVFKTDAPAITRLTEPLLDTPQSIDVISEELLRARAVTNLNEAIRNVPGISIGASEFSWQGNNPSIRGFVARNDMFLDGIRDFGSYYRDPFYLLDIQVLQGPSSILFGRGSTGGVINQSSKSPMLDSFVNGSLVGGTDLTRRGTLDVNMPLPEWGEGVAFRVNAMGHAQNVTGRNVVKQSRFGFAPSLALGLGTPTRLTFSYFDLTASDVPDFGHPWFGTVPVPVPRQNFYGFDNDYLKTTTDVGTFKIEHDLNPAVVIRNTARYAYYTRSLRISEPIITSPVGTPLNAVPVSFNIFSGDSTETMAWDQLEGVVHFATGGIDHALVVGVEGGRETSTPTFNNSSGVPTVPLLNPDPHRLFNAASTFPRFTAKAVGSAFSTYVIDTLKFGEQWEINAGFRWDYFKVDYKTTRFSTTTPGLVTSNDNIQRTDKMPSFRGALIYKPQENGSVYFSYGTSFNPSAESLNFIVNARAFGVSNKDLEPEENQTYELGTKWNVLNNQLALSASIFRLEKTNARVPDPTNPGFNMLEGGQRVDGFDLGAVGRLTDNWQLNLGYAYLDSSVTKTAAGGAPVGAALANTPKNSFTFFTEYRFGGGPFKVGMGGLYVSKRLAQNTAPVKTAPAYFVFDLLALYDISERMSVQLNVNNLFGEYYYEGLHPFHIVPGPGRTALVTLNFRY